MQILKMCIKICNHMGARLFWNIKWKNQDMKVIKQYYFLEIIFEGYKSKL